MATPSIDPGARRAGALATAALHVLAGAALLAHEPSRQALYAAVPVMVELIAPPQIESKPEPPVEIPPPKPKPVVKPLPKLPDPPPLMTVPAAAPAPVEAAPLPSAPAQPVAATPLAAVAVTAPVFNAETLENPPPPYPTRSRRLGEQGRVVLRVLVNPGGTADEVQIRDSSGHARLDEAARDTVLRWRFVPAKRGELAVPAWVLIPVSFRLDG